MYEKVYHAPPAGKGKNTKRAQVTGEIPAASGVVDGQVPTAVGDASSESTAIVGGRVDVDTNPMYNIR